MACHMTFFTLRKQKNTCFSSSHCHWFAPPTSCWDFRFQTVKTEHKHWKPFLKYKVNFFCYAIQTNSAYVERARGKKTGGIMPQTCSSWMALRWVSIVLLFSWSLLSICTVSDWLWTFQHWIFSTSSNSLENSCAGLQLVWEISTNREVNWQVSELTVHPIPALHICTVKILPHPFPSVKQLSSW